MKSSNILVKIIVGVGVLIAVVSLYILLMNDVPQKKIANSKDIIIDNDGIKIGGDFELFDQDGNKFSERNLHGKLSLVYFGFTYCPDICPASLQKIAEVVNILKRSHIEVVPVFITIDPTRDKLEVLKVYLKNFHPKFVGLSGSEEQIRDVANKFKVYYAVSNFSNTESNKSDYMLDHSSLTYLLDKKGQYVKHFYLDSSPIEIVNFIQNNKIMNE